MSWYKTGTVTVTNGSPTITGAGASWVDAGTLNAGDIMSLPDGNLYEIQSINSNNGITLASNYLGGSLSGQAYAIMPIGLLPSALAQQVKSVLTTANTALASAVRFDTAAQGLTSGQRQNARTNIAALGAADVGAGRLSKSVAGGADVALTATEAANQFIELTGALTANINVTVPAAARLFMIYNATSGAYTLTVKTAAGTGVAVPQGSRVVLECDGTNVVNPVTCVTGTLTAAGSAGEGMLISSRGGQVIRLYSETSGGHQWDIYGSGNNLRFSDNTGGGEVSIDQNVVCGANLSVPPTNGIFLDGLGDTYIKEASANVMWFGTGGTERARITATGYIKASNSGTYEGATVPYHELYKNEDNANWAAQITHTGSTAGNQYGLKIRLGGDPNGAGNQFLYCEGNASMRAAIRSNGGIENYQANDVNLSDERLKSNLSPLASPAWGMARALGDLIEEGEYADAPGRRLWMMRAQRVEQAGFNHLVDRNVRNGLALMRGLHEQQIDMIYRRATSEVLAWADDEVRPALADYSTRLARIEQHLTLN